MLVILNITGRHCSVTLVLNELCSVFQWCVCVCVCVLTTASHWGNDGEISNKQEVLSRDLTHLSIDRLYVLAFLLPGTVSWLMWEWSLSVRDWLGSEIDTYLSEENHTLFLFTKRSQLALVHWQQWAGIATELWVVRAGDLISVEARFSAPVKTGCGVHPVFCATDAWFLSRG
jgi:hypothetical protein